MGLFPLLGFLGVEELISDIDVVVSFSLVVDTWLVVDSKVETNGVAA